MKWIHEFFIISFFAILGEVTRLVTHLPIPGSILGILYLFLAFKWHVLEPNKVATTGNFLLNNLAILFVPAGVGLLDYFEQISGIWLILLGTVVCCSVVTLAVTGKTTEVIIKLRNFLSTRKQAAAKRMEEGSVE